MDFRRIELIFLVVFIGLNLFLFGSYRQNQNIQKINPVATSKDETVLKEMRQDDIIFDKLASKKSGGYYLSGQAETANQLVQNYVTLKKQKITFDGLKMNSEFETPLKFDKGQAVSTIEKFMKEDGSVMFGDKYTYAAEFSTSDTLVFLQAVPEGQLFDEMGQLIFKIQDDEVKSYAQTFLENITVLKEKETTISAKQAVINLYTYNEIPAGSTIKWTKLVYTKLVDVDGKSVFQPAWYIGISNKKQSTVNVRRVNAFSGALMKK